MNTNGNLIEKVASSSVYQDYERAFGDATGLPLALRPVESWQLPHRGKRNENPFCALMAQKSRACAACLQTQQKLADQARLDACSVTCAHGLTDTAVPLRLGDKLIGFLQTGQVFTRKPSESQFEKTVRLATEWGLPVDRDQLRQVFFGGRVVSQKQHASAVKLLSIFAQHLSLISNRIFVEQQNAEPPIITRAKEYIHNHQGEDFSLGDVAKAVNTSTFYFCKLFKKGTGLNFTDYVSRVRIEKAKNLLLNPNLRISEIAYEVGFQSLTHFNRVFKRVVGEAPTIYRTRIRSA